MGSGTPPSMPTGTPPPEGPPVWVPPTTGTAEEQRPTAAPPQEPVQGQPMPSQYNQPPPPGGYYPTPQGAPPPVVVQAQGIPGMRTRPPRQTPQQGQVIIGWETCPPEVGCCMCETLSPTGWLVVILVAILFWPCAFIPCLMQECHESTCRPVYGWPQANQGYQGYPPPQQQQQGQVYPPQNAYYPPAAPSHAP